MKTTYDPNLKAHISVDENKNVRHIRHSQEYWQSEANIPRVSAESYLKEWSNALQIPKEQLQNLNKKVSFYDPREQSVEYHLNEENHVFDSTTVGYYQTYLNTPVWRRGLSVKIKQNPHRVVASTNNSDEDLSGALPDKTYIDQYRRIFKIAEARKAMIDAGLGETQAEEEGEAEALVRKSLNLAIPQAKPARGTAGRADESVRLLSGKFFIYKYDPKRRYAGLPSPPEQKKESKIAEERDIPFPKLPPVDDKIKSGRAYLVAELMFSLAPRGRTGLVWLILVEVETGSILYIECMTCAVNGLVFKRDPMVSSGDLTITADQTSAVLDDYDFDEVLNDLTIVGAGNQGLSGTYVVIQEESLPTIAAPTKPMGTDFDYDPRTDNFGAVNAYYHQTELFRTIADLGFDVEDYFDGTTFPVPVDHRANFGDFPNGEEINAYWQPNGSGGTDHLGFCLGDLTDLANPLCRAVDPYVHWHEMGGHGSLGDWVGSGSLGFSHSHGDGLAAIQNDPESGLRALPELFRYAPFRPFTTERRFDRDVGAGWGWGGAEDPGTGSGAPTA